MLKNSFHVQILNQMPFYTLCNHVNTLINVVSVACCNNKMILVPCHKKLTTGFIDCQDQFMMQGVPELVNDEIQLGNSYKEQVNKIL